MIYSRPTPRAVATVTAKSVPEKFARMKAKWKDKRSVNADYGAVKDSEQRRQRLWLGGTADAHSYIWREFWELRERARAYDRDDILVEQMVNRAVDNVVGKGIETDPTPGDTKLKEEMKEEYNAVRTDPMEYDVARRHNGAFYSWLAHRHMLVDGDVFVRLFRSGAHAGKMQFLEGDRIDSPGRIDDEFIHGIEIDDYGAPKNYYILKHTAKQQKWRRYYVPDVQSKEAYDVVPAVDSLGRPNILHVYSPTRITQTRGITAFHAAFDYLGMFEDVNYAKLVQQQVVSCISAFVTSERDIQVGDRDETTYSTDGSERFAEGLEPGKIISLLRGEGVQGFSPGVPNPEFFLHVKLLLRLIGGAFGLPIEITLYDTTDTTFHGYRGALQQAYIGFRRLQANLVARFERPAYQFWAENWLYDNYQRFRGLERKTARWRKLLSSRHIPPTWPYVDPKKDAEADDLRISAMLSSPRRVLAEQGLDNDDIIRETVEDNAMKITAAVKAALAIEEETGQFVDWHELIGKEVFLQEQLGPEIVARTEKTDAETEKTEAETEAVKDGEKNDLPQGGSNADPGEKGSGDSA